MIEKLIGLFVRILLVKRLLADRRAGRWDIEEARLRDAARREDRG